MNETLKHEKQTLTFLHVVLPTWEQTAKSSKCQTAPVRITESDKVSQDFSVGISQRTSETHLLRGRASTAQQGRGWLD